MNTDRFLTRVFDKQEKKMIYFFGEEGFMLDYEGEECTFDGITSGGIMVEYEKHIRNDFFLYIPAVLAFKDRFIPMLCSGMKIRAKNKKLIYDGDILGGHPHGAVFVEFNQEYGMYECVWFDEDVECDEGTPKKCTQLLGNALNDCGDEWEVMGDIHQNEELYKKILEGKA